MAKKGGGRGPFETEKAFRERMAKLRKEKPFLLRTKIDRMINEHATKKPALKPLTDKEKYGRAVQKQRTAKSLRPPIRAIKKPTRANITQDLTKAVKDLEKWYKADVKRLAQQDTARKAHVKSLEKQRRILDKAVTRATKIKGTVKGGGKTTPPKPGTFLKLLKSAAGVSGVAGTTAMHLYEQIYGPLFPSKPDPWGPGGPGT